jgi:hypothetical protein
MKGTGRHFFCVICGVLAMSALPRVRRANVVLFVMNIGAAIRSSPLTGLMRWKKPPTGWSLKQCAGQLTASMRIGFSPER